MQLNLRNRHWIIIVALILVPLLFIFTSPDAGLIGDMKYGSEILTYMVYAMQSFILLLLLYIFRKLMHDYKSSDVDKLLSKATEDPVGAGLAVIAMSIFTLAYSLLIFAVINIK